MSMMAYLQSISPHLIEAVQANPELLSPLLEQDSDVSNNDLAELADASESALEIGKDWHGIHFLLTDQAWDTPGVLGQVVLGGTEIGEDLGYGPARLLTPEQVKEIAQALATLAPGFLQAKFDPDQMNAADIYPGWEEADGDSLFQSFQALTTYYQAAAEGGLGMLSYLL